MLHWLRKCYWTFTQTLNKLICTQSFIKMSVSHTNRPYGPYAAHGPKFAHL